MIKVFLFKTEDNSMKRKYKILAYCIGVEIFIIYMLNALEFSIKTWIGNALGVVAFFLPVQILLFMVSRDENCSKKKRIFCKIIFWHIIGCFLGATIVTLIYHDELYPR